MRKYSQKQLYIRFNRVESKSFEELSKIKEIFNELEGFDDLCQEVVKHLGDSSRGREGLSGERILKLSFLRSYFDCSFRELSEKTDDSVSVRAFLDIPEGSLGYSRSCIAKYIKGLREEVLEKFNALILKYATRNSIEDGKVLRSDTTVTKSNIHYPTDGNLLFDSIKVLSRLLEYLKQENLIEVRYKNHYRQAKKLLFAINNCRGDKKRKALQIKILNLCKKTLNYAEENLILVDCYDNVDIDILQIAIKYRDKLKLYIPRIKNVIEQAERRIKKKEKVPANEKIFSIFEDHTDMIIKSFREIFFGHKISLASGKSSLITQIDILSGNPSDSSLVKNVIQNHKDVFLTAPEKITFDGSYGSKENKDFLLKEGIENLSFGKRANLDSFSEQSNKKKLRNFRAGIEANISFLKRSFGLWRVLDKGINSFRAWIKSSVIAYNLTLISRIFLNS